MRRLLAVLVLVVSARDARAQLRNINRTATPQEIMAERTDWGADLSFDGAANRGNSDVDRLGGGFDAFKSWGPTTVYLNGSAIYSSVSSIANQNQGVLALRADHVVDGPWKVFAFDTNSYNQIIQVDYRTTNGVGPWYDFSVYGTTHAVSVALAYEYERFVGGSEQSAVRVPLRDMSRFPVSDVAEITTDAFYIPRVDIPADFRLYGEVAFHTFFWKKILGLKLSFSDEYQSRPQPGVKRNDTIWLTALTVHLGR